jgi:hypothetical protein
MMQELTDKIGQLLHGHPPEVQGTVLADLLSMWLAEFFVDREHVLAEHLDCVRALIPLNERLVLERNREGAH